MAESSPSIVEIVKDIAPVIPSEIEQENEASLSLAVRNRFYEHAIQDEETKEMYMTPLEFLNAIAPESGDYVSSLAAFHLWDLNRLVL